MAQRAQPAHFEWLAVIVVMPLRTWITALLAGQPFYSSLLDGVIELITSSNLHTPIRVELSLVVHPTSGDFPIRSSAIPLLFKAHHFTPVRSASIPSPVVQSGIVFGFHVIRRKRGTVVLTRTDLGPIYWVPRCPGITPISYALSRRKAQPQTLHSVSYSSTVSINSRRRCPVSSQASLID